MPVPTKEFKWIYETLDKLSKDVVLGNASLCGRSGEASSLFLLSGCRLNFQGVKSFLGS